MKGVQNFDSRKVEGEAFQNHPTKCKCNLSIIFTISVSEIEIWKIVQIYCYIYITSVNNKIALKSIKSNPNKTIAFIMTLLINMSTLNWWKSQNNKKLSCCAWTLGFEPHKSSSPYLPSKKKKNLHSNSRVLISTLSFEHIKIHMLLTLMLIERKREGAIFNCNFFFFLF